MNKYLKSLIIGVIILALLYVGFIIVVAVMTYNLTANNQSTQLYIQGGLE